MSSRKKTNTTSAMIWTWLKAALSPSLCVSHSSVHTMHFCFEHCALFHSFAAFGVFILSKSNHSIIFLIWRWLGFTWYRASQNGQAFAIVGITEHTCTAITRAMLCLIRKMSRLMTPSRRCLGSISHRHQDKHRGYFSFSSFPHLFFAVHNISGLHLSDFMIPDQRLVELKLPGLGHHALNFCLPTALVIHHVQFRRTCSSTL